MGVTTPPYKKPKYLLKKTNGEKNRCLTSFPDDTSVEVVRRMKQALGEGMNQFLSAGGWSFLEI